MTLPLLGGMNDSAAQADTEALVSWSVLERFIASTQRDATTAPCVESRGTSGMMGRWLRSAG